MKELTELSPDIWMTDSAKINDSPTSVNGSSFHFSGEKRQDWSVLSYTGSLHLREETLHLIASLRLFAGQGSALSSLWQWNIQNFCFICIAPLAQSSVLWRKLALLDSFTASYTWNAVKYISSHKSLGWHFWKILCWWYTEAYVFVWIFPLHSDRSGVILKM